jgi:hypothetical protein
MSAEEGVAPQLSLNCSDEYSAPIQEPRKSHVMPHALYGGGGEHVTTTRVSFYRRQRVLEIDRRSFSGYRPLKRDNERQNLRTEGRRVNGGKLFHREERPARERDIIDTSEWTWANYRYVIGQHFGLWRYTNGTCNFVQRIRAFVYPTDYQPVPWWYLNENGTVTVASPAVLAISGLPRFAGRSILMGGLYLRSACASMIPWAGASCRPTVRLSDGSRDTQINFIDLIGASTAIAGSSELGQRRDGVPVELANSRKTGIQSMMA